MRALEEDSSRGMHEGLGSGRLCEGSQLEDTAIIQAPKDKVEEKIGRRLRWETNATQITFLGRVVATELWPSCCLINRGDPTAGCVLEACMNRNCLIHSWLGFLLDQWWKLPWLPVLVCSPSSRQRSFILQ